jgi:DNA-binding transcriptional ArsR family regulator
MRIAAHVNRASASAPRGRARAARGLREIFDENLFRALCEPVRVALVEFLTVRGRSDIATVAAAFPQDRSVISRHLASLCEAGVVRREKVGRHVFFAVDGPGMLRRLEEILERFRRIVSICCPPERSDSPGDRRPGA